MLSRVAENLYWISRYVERAENVARLLDVGFHLELDASGLSGDVGGQGPIESVLTILACREAFEAAHGPASRRTARPCSGSSRSTDQPALDPRHDCARARENARGTQETLSGEAWSQVNKLYLYLCSPRAQKRFAASPSRFFDGIKRACILFDGLVDGTLPPDRGLPLPPARPVPGAGQPDQPDLERQAPRAPRRRADRRVPMRIVHWSSLLRSCSAYEAYLREHHDTIDPEGWSATSSSTPTSPAPCGSASPVAATSLREIAGGDEEEYRHRGRAPARPARQRAALHRRRRDLRRGL